MFQTEKSLVYLDGEFVSAKDPLCTLLNSQSMLNGTGALEGIRSYQTPFGTRLFKGKAHFDRLLYSCSCLGITLDYSATAMVKKTYELLRLNGLTNAYVSALVFTGEAVKGQPQRKGHLFIQVAPHEEDSEELPLQLMSSSFQAAHPRSTFADAKLTGTRISGVLATNEALANGFDAALLSGYSGHVAGGATANFFFESNGILYTPPPADTFPGITRATLLDLCIRHGFPFEEASISLKDLKAADSAFFASTAGGIQRIASIDGHRMEQPWRHSTGFQLGKLYRELLVGSEETSLSPSFSGRE